MDDVDDTVAPHVRRLRRRAVLDRLQGSLLFLPLVTLLVAGVVLQETARRIDQNIQVSWLQTFSMTPDAATTLLSTDRRGHDHHRRRRVFTARSVPTTGQRPVLAAGAAHVLAGPGRPGADRPAAGNVRVLRPGAEPIDTAAARAPTVTMALAILLALASILAIVSYLNRITRQQYVGRIMERIQDEALRLISDLPYGPRIGHRCGEPVAEPNIADLGTPLIVRPTPTAGSSRSAGRRCWQQCRPAASYGWKPGSAPISYTASRSRESGPGRIRRPWRRRRA